MRFTVGADIARRRSRPSGESIVEAAVEIARKWHSGCFNIEVNMAPRSVGSRSLQVQTSSAMISVGRGQP